jgi:hypothetical protein
MILICYLGTAGDIVVYRTVTTYEEIKAAVEEVRNNEHRSSLQASQLFTLDAGKL